jgi:poly(A) polymerase Pap1
VEYNNEEYIFAHDEEFVVEEVSSEQQDSTGNDQKTLQTKDSTKNKLEVQPKSTELMETSVATNENAMNDMLEQNKKRKRDFEEDVQGETKKRKLDNLENISTTANNEATGDNNAIEENDENSYQSVDFTVDVENVDDILDQFL